jgi:hypothetical protein
MASPRARVLSTLAAFVAAMLPAGAQSVISTHSGVIHFFEGNVYLGDQSLKAHLGKYPSIPQGGELRTADGRAEVLLTPGVFLRMGERTAIRMVANDLADTRVELEAGSVVVDSGEPNLNTSVSMMYKNWRVHVLDKGVYRIDSDPPRLWVRQGQAEVFAGVGGQPVSVEAGMSLPFAGVLVSERSSEPSTDGLGDWSTGRSQSITADNAITAQIDEDPGAQTLDADAFSYFPMLGVYYPPLGVPSVAGGSSAGSSLVPYSVYNPYQPGFNSIYLPGYTYRPFIVGLVVGPVGRRFPTRLPGASRLGMVYPGTGLAPIRPVGAGVHPAAVHAPVVVHGAAHR